MSASRNSVWMTRSAFSRLLFFGISTATGVTSTSCGRWWCWWRGNWGNRFVSAAAALRSRRLSPLQARSQSSSASDWLVLEKRKICALSCPDIARFDWMPVKEDWYSFHISIYEMSCVFFLKMLWTRVILCIIEAEKFASYFNIWCMSIIRKQN